MLCPASYRAAESAARARLSDWRSLQAHHLGAFHAVGFPVRVESLSELGMLLNSMQDGRAEKYRIELAEMGAPDPYDEINDHGRFAATFFQHHPGGLTHDAILSMAALYQKLERAAPGFKRVLEFGPGCGYLPFFLKNRKGFRHYVSAEACESFYLLQSLVNAWCFGPEAEDWALGLRSGPVKCTHVPWWRLSEITTEQFDVVTANACLLEMTPAALNQYLSIAAAVLPKGAPFVAQCFGHNQYGTPESLIDAFSLHGFKLRSRERIGPTRATHNGVWERL